MLPSKALRLLLGSLLAADTGTLAPATANKMILFKNNINPNENTLVGDLVEADFDGYAAIVGTVGTQETGVDPATGDQVITIKPPLAGWRWVTTGLTHLPETIYGFALVDTTKATLLAIETFVDPVTLTAVGQQIDLGKAYLTMVQQPLS